MPSLRRIRPISERRCQWLEGLITPFVSATARCCARATARVRVDGVLVGCVCNLHGIHALCNFWQVEPVKPRKKKTDCLAKSAKKAKSIPGGSGKKSSLPSRPSRGTRS